MDRVGGFDSYQLLIEDARAYDDIVIELMGRAKAARIQDLQRRARG